MPVAYINIGSNQGDRRANIAHAVALITDKLHVKPSVSTIVESEPWGYASALPYLNVGVAFDTTLSPVELLDRLLSIERSISPAPHRTADGTYADRIIDIDLIACDNVVLNEATTPGGDVLTLPHPRMHLRTFVLGPMAELAPTWVHPQLKLTSRELLAAIAGG
jgi:2-amino-4-hydroxy-6-hydroxymethyldihydropteridine diphosphokinase